MDISKLFPIFVEVMTRVIIEESGFLKEKKDFGYEKKNEALKQYINSFPLVIDRSVFTKTKKEKQLVNKLKRQFKNK